MRSGLRLQVGQSVYVSGFTFLSAEDMEAATTKTIQIVVNGQVRDVPQARSLVETLIFLDIDPSRVAIELDRVIVSRAAWDQVRVNAGSALEIVQFVGGG